MLSLWSFKSREACIPTPNQELSERGILESSKSRGPTDTSDNRLQILMWGGFLFVVSQSQGGIFWDVRVL